MDQLRQWREARELSQVKLAAKADLNPATVNQIERGVRDASPGTLRKLANALGISLYELLEVQAPKAPAPSSLLRNAEEARRLVQGRVSPWLHLLDRKAERWEQAAAAGRADRSFHQEVSADFDDSMAAVGILTKDLDDEGFIHKAREAPDIAAIGRELGQGIRRLLKAKEELDLIFERELNSDELAHHKARKAKAAAAVEELTISIGA